MGTVPFEWQALLGGPALTGNCCRSIISKHSFGPAVSVFDPEDIDREKRIAAETLVHYTSRNQLGSGETSKNPFFNRATRVEGVAFPDNTRSVLFFGKHGTGEFCYGTGSECGDAARSQKGNHAYPYVYQVWAYDANDLLRVKRGKMQPYRVLPYDIWQIELPQEVDNAHDTGGVAFDPASRNLYFSQIRGDVKHLPLIHVFRIKSP